MKEISYIQSLALARPVYIDVRSPAEFLEDHIPGAVNEPLLDNEQRRIVGTLYRKEGAQAAREKGLEMVMPRLEEKMIRIEELARQNPVVIYCWRGGMRSKSVAEYLSSRGHGVYKLQQGYKEYRRVVVSDLEAQMVFPPLIILYGLTGTGKTEILGHLQTMGTPVLDLEGYANHRGSAFGSVGLGCQPAQKTFESLLHQGLLMVPEGQVAVVEGESRKIGRIHIPPRFFEHLRSSSRILIYDTVENRVERIVREYTLKQDREGLVRGVKALERRLGRKSVEQFIQWIDRGEYEPVVRELLIRYYDPLYKHPQSPSGAYDASVDGSDPLRAAQQIHTLLINAKE